LEVKSGRRVGLTTLPPSMSRMSENVGASTFRNPKGLHGLYRNNFYLFTYIRYTINVHTYFLQNCSCGITELVDIKYTLKTVETASMMTNLFIENCYMFRPNISSSGNTLIRNFIIELFVFNYHTKMWIQFSIGCHKSEGRGLDSR
jgi:hypothetical protein